MIVRLGVSVLKLGLIAVSGKCWIVKNRSWVISPCIDQLWILSLGVVWMEIRQAGGWLWHAMCFLGGMAGLLL